VELAVTRLLQRGSAQSVVGRIVPSFPFRRGSCPGGRLWKKASD